MCLQRLKEAIGDQKTSNEQKINSENEEKISYESPLSSTDATSTSHIYEATIGNELTLSNTNKRHRTNSISVVSYYKYILMNITRVIYRNQNKRF
jgi:hypothetical protein